MEKQDVKTDYFFRLTIDGELQREIWNKSPDGSCFEPFKNLFEVYGKTAASLKYGINGPHKDNDRYKIAVTFKKEKKIIILEVGVKSSDLYTVENLINDKFQKFKTS